MSFSFYIIRQRYKDTMIWFNVTTRSLQTETLLTVRKRSWPIYKLKKTVIRERVLVENKTGRSFRMFKFRASSFHAKNKNKVETIKRHCRSSFSLPLSIHWRFAISPCPSRLALDLPFFFMTLFFFSTKTFQNNRKLSALRI